MFREQCVIGSSRRVLGETPTTATWAVVPVSILACNEEPSRCRRPSTTPGLRRGGIGEGNGEGYVLRAVVAVAEYLLFLGIQAHRRSSLGFEQKTALSLINGKFYANH